MKTGSWRMPALLVGLVATALCGASSASAGPGASGAALAGGCGAELDAAHRRVATAAWQEGAVTVAFVPDPAPWAVGRHFSLRGVVCGPARLLRVDADMPAHRHGMNYRPTLQLQEEGRFTAQGLLLHMPGRWRIRLEVEAQGRRQWLEQTVDVK